MDLTAILLDALGAAIGPGAAVYALLAIGLNVHFGYTGLLNFGQAGFMLLGAYGAAVTVAVLGGSLWLGVLVGVVLAVALALVVGAPTLRLHAGYLAIVTIAAAEALRHLFGSRFALPFTGGPLGLRHFADGFHAANPLPPGEYGLGFVSLGSEERLWTLLVGWLVVAGAILLVWRLVESPWGRVVRTIRDDAATAETLGKDAFRHRMQSLILGGVIGALAGVLLAVDQQTVHPAQYLPFVTFAAYAALILGGSGSILGPVAGAVVLVFATESLETFLGQLDATGLLDVPPMAVTYAQVGLVSLALVLLVIFRPQGILGDRREQPLTGTTPPRWAAANDRVS